MTSRPLSGRSELLAGIWFAIALLAFGEEPAARGVVVVSDPAGEQVGLYRGSYALLIGVSDYTAWPDLESVPRELKKVRRPFVDFIKRYGRKPDNRLLFFFAGHGHTLEKGYRHEMGYIMPGDAPRP